MSLYLKFKSMKHILLFVIGFFIFNSLSSQPWLENLPKNKTNYTYYDYRTAFDSYWSSFGVDKSGYYFENGVKKKAAGWKQFNRWAWNLESQINPETGEFPQFSAQQVYDDFIQNNPIQSPMTTTPAWTSLGTNSSSGGYAGIGRVNCIAFHPTDNNTYWIGTPAGGLWKTTNNGSSWTCLTDSNDVMGVSSIIIPSDYATSNTIYIATGDRDAWDNRSIGVLKSTNGGQTWNTTALTYTLASNTMVNKLLLDPNNNNTILAATSNGLYKTTNGGTTWSTQLTSTDFIDIEFKPNSTSTIYGSTTDGKIYVSTNSGSTWSQKLNTGYRIELAVTPNNSNMVYAVVAASNNGLQAIYKSTNSGASFSSIYNSTNLLGWEYDGSDSGGQGWYDLSLAVSPTNSNVLIVGGVITHKSSNGGSSWSCSNFWYTTGLYPVAHADKHNLVYRSNGDLFECNDGGVYISTNNGTTWTYKSNGLVISQMYKLSVSKTVASETITGLQDNGTKLLSNGSWSDVKGGDGMECLIDYTDVNTQYGTYTYGQISRTTDHWVNSTDIEPSAAGNGAWVTPYIIHPTNHNTLYAGYSNVYKTTNKGSTWTQISTMNSTSKIRSMAISSSNSSVLYVADNNHIWKTINGGTNWTNVTNSLPVSTSNITYIAIKSTDPNTVWVTLSGYNSNSVYKTTNGGTSWSNLSTGLPSIPMYSIVQDTSYSTSDMLYVGTELGVYYKEGTNNWLEYNTALPKVKIGELEIYYDNNPTNSKLRAATFGRGLWECDLFSAASLAPISDFSPNSKIICTGDTISFSDSSLYAPTSWQWVFTPSNVTFVNGTNASSQNPEVKFSSAGYYSVALTASNASGNNTKTETNLIKVGGFQTPFVEEFETTSTTLSEWRVSNPDGQATWSLATTSGNGTSARSVAMSYYSNNTAGQRDDLFTPVLNLSGLATASLQFKHAYTRYSSSSTDSLIVLASGNCGATWTRIAAMGENGSGSFATAPDATYTYSSSFVPSISTDWCGAGYGADCDSIDISSFAGNPNVMIAFQGYDNYGNNLFLDNINIFGSASTAVAASFTMPSSSVCSGSQVTFTNTSLNATSYIWKENGSVISTSQNLTKSYLNAGNYTIKLIATNGSTSDSTSQIITINPTPSQASTPSGPTNVCQNSSANSSYSTATVANANNYQWTITPASAGTISSNANNAVITWASSYYGAVDIQVQASNLCGNGIISSALTASISSVPDSSSVPVGPNTLCVNPNNTSYTCSNITNATAYQWSISPSNAGTISNSGINATVDWNDTYTGNATLSVIASNTCGNSLPSAPLNIVINQVPGNTSTPYGPNNICKDNVNTNYNVSTTNYASTYNWDLTPATAGTITPNGKQAIIDWDSQFIGAASLKVSASNNCGTGPFSNNFSITVNDNPPTPTITRSFDTLMSSSATGNQWYYSNSLINGATNTIYIASNNGNYYVRVSDANGCSSKSTNYLYNSVGVDNNNIENVISIFPNPTTGEITVDGKGINQISIFNIHGQLVEQFYVKKNQDKINLDLSNNASGVYFIKLITDAGTITEKIIME